MDSPVLSRRPPELGDLVFVRSRRWLVEDVVAPVGTGPTVVRLACADDDNQGQVLEVFWDLEPDGRIMSEEGWKDIGARGFDPTGEFSAFLHTLRWNCVTATNPDIFQAPFRAGIHIDAYQMEPLRRALRLPRVNLFIADDTGLGKTIEAGLIARELLLRRKASHIVVAAPASVLEQWQDELEERFGLVFQIVDRAYLSKVRQERGFGVNPWRTRNYFLISQSLLINSTYTDPLKEWLGPFLPGSLLILDEAHHAAPATGRRYGIETKFTRAVRDLAGRFEHRLFLSATPHNGHSNSFSTLLELLDPYRFTRGVPVRGRRDLEEIMVRRLKEDVRALQGGFPERKVVRVEISGLPEDAPELQLSRLLDEYRQTRAERFQGASKRSVAAAGLLVVGLQQRLLSSTEAFARSLRVHRETVNRQWERAGTVRPSSADTDDALQLLIPADADDERASWSSEQLDAEEAEQIRAAAAAAEAGVSRDETTLRLWAREQELLDEMEQIAELARYRPDAKLMRLVDWIRANQCPELPPLGRRPAGPPPRWTNRRVIIFTENREGTKRYLVEQLGHAIEHTERAEERILVIDGLTSGEIRREIQRRFNTDPTVDPLRILIATDAAREGLNFQAHCADLFHFDLPWNPGRLEQRNGRIDRKLQPEPEVRCHYFVLPQRKEDRVLEVLVQKTETIKRELGSLSKVIEADIERLLKGGIAHDSADEIARSILGAQMEAERAAVIEAELEAARDRQEEVKAQITRCQNLLDGSREWVRFDEDAFRQALSCSLGILGAEPLKPGRDAHGNEVWEFPRLDRRAEADASWAATLDTLRGHRRRNQSVAEWRRDAPVRPVVFRDPMVLTDEVVHLHLEQRVANRLLQRFRAQGFIHHDLSRACLAQTADSIPRVVLLGRLSLFGQRAERLHEEVISVTARWLDPSERRGPIGPYARDAEARTLALLDDALTVSEPRPISDRIRARLLQSASQDVAELLPHLEPRAADMAAVAVGRLAARGVAESKQLLEILQRQQARVRDELAKAERDMSQLALFEDEERRQREADMRSWRTRLAQFERDLGSEPERIQRFYDVRKTRVEPIGLVYLWPDTN